MEQYNLGFRICSCCGKRFIPGAEHAYRANGKIQCSYTCYRKEGGDNGEYKKRTHVERAGVAKTVQTLRKKIKE